MSAQRRASHSLILINALLLSSTIPAMAQLEEVVVTAQKKTEAAQTVPINITAFTGQDLQSQHINQFKDLQFHAPNVTYTAGNFGGADFQIRGIGVTAIGYDAESGVAVNFNEVYLAAPNLTEGSFYDLSGVEVLAGPQSTLYGRGATGGVVNINIMKPDLENPEAEVIGQAGNFSSGKVWGYGNIPIVNDKLGLRVAGEWDRRDGFVKNIFNDTRTDGLDEYSARATLRWEPSNQTTVDVTGQFQWEDDDHMRSNKQLCTTDPTGVLGCLPGSAGRGVTNPFSNLSVIASSQQGLESVFGPVGAFLGLFNLSSQFTLPPGTVLPTGIRQISTDFQPIWKSQDNFVSVKWLQNVTPWLDSTFIAGYDRNSYFSEQSYNNVPGLLLPSFTGPAIPLAACAAAPNVNCAAQIFPVALGAAATAPPPFGPGFTPAQAAAYIANFAPFFAHVPLSGQAFLPISGTNNLGITGGDFTFTNKNEAFDRADATADQYSVEWRFATSFTGPLNGMMGYYYLHTRVSGDYFVNAPTLDYPGIVLGAFSGLADPACFATGCILAPSYYHNVGENATLNSNSLFGEAYYTAIPDTLKFTAGLRWTDDQKNQLDRILLFNTLIPIGTTHESAIPDFFDSTSQDFRKVTGRFVADWTPKIAYTDATLIYASYARGYKAGGANPGIQTNNNPFDLPLTYRPEFIDAYEIGTKNTLLHGQLQANGDIYYYNYTDLQVSTIQSNTSINENINAHVWGAEGSFIWQATDHLQLGLNFAHEESRVVDTQLVDTRNPTGGDPNTLLIKDNSISGTTGGNCVVYFNGPFPGLPAGYTAPAGGEAALAPFGVAHSAFGSCQPAALAALTGAGFNLGNGTTMTSQGVAVSLDGNELQNTPTWSFSVDAQYIQPLGNGYNLVGRFDIHYQNHFWMRIWEDGADFVSNQYTADASLQLNSPDDVWYAQLFAKNIFNQNNITGGYLASQTSGLYTNIFLNDPQTYGVELGVRF
ncbi:MAG TPA: TonB-dependent receptor [Rhizomicrobium sp.]|nr:TonB-dependent receptor [Rhizomicrobium sp.]